jgi:hypothetical protein
MFLNSHEKICAMFDWLQLQFPTHVYRVEKLVTVVRPARFRKPAVDILCKAISERLQWAGKESGSSKWQYKELHKTNSLVQPYTEHVHTLTFIALTDTTFHYTILEFEGAAIAQSV